MKNYTPPDKDWLLICFAAGFIVGITVGAFAVFQCYRPTEPDQTESTTIVSPLPEPLIYQDEIVSSEPETTAGAAESPAETSSTQTLTYYDIPLTNEQQDAVRAICDEYSVPFDLALAMMRVESNYDPSAVSSTNDHGIMQINAINHETLEKLLGITDWYDLQQNTMAGCYLLGKALERHGGVGKALMAYNLGDRGAQRKWDQGVYSTAYVEKILTARDALTIQQ